MENAASNSFKSVSPQALLQENQELTSVDYQPARATATSELCGQVPSRYCKGCSIRKIRQTRKELSPRGRKCLHGDIRVIDSCIL